MKGILTLRIDSDGGSIRISFDKLVPIHEDCKNSTSSTQTTTSQQSQQEKEGNSDHDHVHNSRQNIHLQEGSPTHNGMSQSRSQTQTQTSQKGPVRCTVKVDSKKLHASLHWQATLGIRDVSSAVLCMWENEMLVLDVTLNPEIGRFMYYIPVHYVSSTDDVNLD